MRGPAAAGLAALLLLGTGCDEQERSAPHTPVDSTGIQLEGPRPDKGNGKDDGPAIEAPPLTKRVRPARDAAELAARLVVDDGVLKTAGTGTDLFAAAAFDTQVMYRQLAREPRWQPAVLRRVGRLRPVVELHLRARRSLRSVLTTLSDELPAWEVVEPEPADDLRRYYREGERVHGVAWELLAAINFVETGFGKIHGLSTAGAQGPMQFIPSTWAAYGDGDIDDPHDAILGAANYLAANGGGTGAISGPGVENALYRYNNHPGYVDGIQAYASIIERDPAALDALTRWQIISLSSIGDLWLPVGYRQTAPLDVRDYAAAHPERHLGTATS